MVHSLDRSAYPIRYVVSRGGRVCDLYGYPIVRLYVFRREDDAGCRFQFARVLALLSNCGDASQDFVGNVVRWNGQVAIVNCECSRPTVWCLADRDSFGLGARGYGFSFPINVPLERWDSRVQVDSGAYYPVEEVAGLFSVISCDRVNSNSRRLLLVQFSVRVAMVAALIDVPRWPGREVLVFYVRLGGLPAVNE